MQFSLLSLKHFTAIIFRIDIYYLYSYSNTLWNSSSLSNLPRANALARDSMRDYSNPSVGSLSTIEEYIKYSILQVDFSVEYNGKNSSE